MESCAHWEQDGREGGVKEGSDVHSPETLSAILAVEQRGSYSGRIGGSEHDALARTDSQMSWVENKVSKSLIMLKKTYKPNSSNIA